MVKQDSTIKLRNLAVPCDGKESKAGGGYLKPYSVMPAYTRQEMQALYD